MGKACLLLLVGFLVACAPAPIPVTASPTPVSIASPVLAEEHPGNLTLVEFFAIN